MNAEPDRTWRVGELANETGLTVRTLHHYDHIGLLVPSRRDRSDHRRYSVDDVARLHRITALRGFGFGLAAIARLMTGQEDDVRELVCQQLDQVEDRILRATRLRAALTGVLAALDEESEPSAQTLIQLIEVMTAVEHHYTPEELAQLAEGRRRAMAELSPEQLAAMAEQRRAMFERLTPAEVAQLQRSRPPLRPPAS